MFLNFVLVFIRTSNKLVTTALISLSDNPDGYILSKSDFADGVDSWLYGRLPCFIWPSYFWFLMWKLRGWHIQILHLKADMPILLLIWGLGWVFVNVAKWSDTLWNNMYFILFPYSLCVFFPYVVWGHTSAIVPVWRSEGNLWELVRTLHSPCWFQGPKLWTWAYLLRCLPSPWSDTLF